MPEKLTSPLLIENVHLLTTAANSTSIISEVPQAILVSGNQIEAIAESKAEVSDLAQRAATTMNGGGKIAMPGLINSHCHTYATVLRGTENSQPLEVWALYTMAYGKQLSPALIETAAGLSACEMIRSGITSVIDHIPHIGLLDHTLTAHAKYGMRVGVAPFMQDVADHVFLNFDLPNDLRASLEATPPYSPEHYRQFFADFFSRIDAMPDRLIAIIGPNAPQRCSPELWQVWRDLRDEFNAPVHTHLLETKVQALQSREVWEGGLVSEMARQNLLSGNLSVAHAIWLQDHERELLAKHDVTVVHNPTSNLMLGSGTMPFDAYAKLGVPIGIGSDSANTGGRHDVFENARLAAMLPRTSEPDFTKWPAANRVLLESIEAGAKALGLAGELGQLAAGKLADLILVDSNDVRVVGLQTNAEVIAQHAGPGAVTDVMIDGNWVMRDRQLTGVDESQLQTDFENQRAAFQEIMSNDLKQAHAAAPIIGEALSRFR